MTARISICAVSGFGLLIALPLAGQDPASLLGVSLSPSKGPLAVSMPMQIIVLLTLLAILPAVIMSVTPFLRIAVVLHFLRQALSTQGTPSNQVLIGLALFLTLVIMQPVVIDMYHKGWEPLEAGQATWQQAWNDGSQPLKVFLLRYVREKDVRLFLDISHTPTPQDRSGLGLGVLLPAYVISELKTGFQIG